MLMPMEKTFRSMVYERLEDIGSNIVIQDEEYKKRGNESSELYTQLKQILPEEYRNLLFELDCAYNALASIAEVLVYEQGVKDGMKLKDMLVMAE